MSDVVLTEQLDQAIEAMLRSSLAVHADDASGEAQLRGLLLIARALRSHPREAFKTRLRDELIREVSSMATSAKGKSTKKELRGGYRTLTPYLTVKDVHEMIAFIQTAFGAEGKIYGLGSAGGFHSEYRIGDSILMIGGGGKGATWTGTPSSGALHLYVENVDEVYERALKAGGTSLMAPTDQPYLDREAAISDVAGNYWYIATHKGSNYIPEQGHNLMPFLHPKGAPRLIEFLKQAFNAEELGVHKSPDGIVQHAVVRIVDSIIEMGEAHDEWRSMTMTFMLYVDSVDEWYTRAMNAEGAVSMGAPSDQGYARVGTIKDPSGNVWYIAQPPRSS